jgi:3-phytase
MRAASDVDDPSIWLHPTDPSKSLIIATVKAAAPAGALMVYDLDGRVIQQIGNLDRPNNVDIEYGFRFGGRATDIVVTTERLRRQLHVFSIAEDGRGLNEIAQIPVLDGSGNAGAPMGIGLYKRPRDGRIFAIVAPKSGPRENYLREYLLEDAGGRVQATMVRRFGRYSGHGEIEAVAVDDALGYVYYADERSAIHKWRADPDAGDADVELAQFGRDGFSGDREGIAIYAAADGTGYIVCTDQRPGRSEYRLYRREGEPGRPHEHQLVKVLQGPADSTDGIEVTSRALNDAFRQGMLIAMNSKGRNFLLFSWEQIAASGTPRLRAAAAAEAR